MDPPVAPRLWSAILWGVIAGLLYLVLLGGYALVWSSPVSPLRGGGLAVFVGGTTAWLAYTLEVRIASWARNRGE